MAQYNIQAPAEDFLYGYLILSVCRCGGLSDSAAGYKRAQIKTDLTTDPVPCYLVLVPLPSLPQTL